MLKLTDWLTRSLLVLLLLQGWAAQSQELYVFTEPASNMPAHSISAKYTLKLGEGTHSGKLEQRHNPEIMLGLNKKWMIHLASSFSDMYSQRLRWESVKLYSKYRFLSWDEVHRHFRVAAFAQGSYSRNLPFYDELSLDGDQTGVQVGLIATQLLHKLAISTTVSNIQILQSQRWEKAPPQAYPFQGIDYSVSAGYLLLPRNYTSFKQVNLNLYAELLGQQTYDLGRHFVDLAPAIQLIFNSNSKLNLGYRFELSSTMRRMAPQRYLLSFEYTFFNAIR